MKRGKYVYPPLYRVGETLIGFDNLAMSYHPDKDNAFFSFHIHIAGNTIVTRITQREQSMEYARYLALYHAAPLLIDCLENQLVDFLVEAK